MKEEKTTPLRQRMIEDMRILGMVEKTQALHIRPPPLDGWRHAAVHVEKPSG